MHALQLILSVCPIALQTQKAWEARREYDQKQAEAAADEAGSFRGPDGSNQWVSVGELGAEPWTMPLWVWQVGQGCTLCMVHQVQGQHRPKSL